MTEYALIGAAMIAAFGASQPLKQMTAPAPTPSPTAPVSKLATGSAIAVMALNAAQNLCITFTYDANGNRVTQISASLPNQNAVWGSSRFPCFTWASAN